MFDSVSLRFTFSVKTKTFLSGFLRFYQIQLSTTFLLTLAISELIFSHVDFLTLLRSKKNDEIRTQSSVAQREQNLRLEHSGNQTSMCHRSHPVTGRKIVMSKVKVHVIDDASKPHAVEVIADSIVQIAEAMRKINSTRLSRDAIVTLIARQTKVSRSDIERVLDSMDNLENDWLRKPTLKKS